jgi:hypothetical protein
MLFTRLHISTFLGIAAIAWWIVLWARETPVTWHHLAPFSSVVGVLALLAVAFEHILWLFRWLHGWFVKRPDLRGTWKVELRSDWRHPETGYPVPPITCFMGIKQTLSTLQMHLMTPESESWLIADSIVPSPNATGYRVVGVYNNKPQLPLRGDRSEMHQGAIALDTHGPEHRPEALTGEYWTDRKTSGEMELTDRVSKVYTRFVDAKMARGT